MKHLVVSVAGLGFYDLEKRNLLRQAGLTFQPATSVFPAVTCTAQATLRTALPPREHGMTSNGFYDRTLHRPAFWEQSADLVHGPRIWSRARAKGATVGMYFFQQSLGECVDSVISPAPIHKHGGGMIMRNYTQPPEMSETLTRCCGTFPLHRYWGPLASYKVGQAVLKNFFTMTAARNPEIAFLYLPTLDYDAQRQGPDGPGVDAAFAEFARELTALAEFAQKQGAAFSVIGEYAIGSVTAPPARPNVTLRDAGLFRVRPVAGRAYPDFHTSDAFAMCDHEIAHVYVKDAAKIEKVRDVLISTGMYESCTPRVAQDWAHPSAGELLLVAKQGSWCAYPWWTNPREAPDYATHIDIHNKPGYDPCELFFGSYFPPSTCQDWSRIKGSHGRTSTIAWASTNTQLHGETLQELAGNLLV